MANDGGPAFPRVDYFYDRDPGATPLGAIGSSGMTLRDYFAAAVLPAIYAHSVRVGNLQDAIVAEAYELADAMLDARATKKSEAES